MKLLLAILTCSSVVARRGPSLSHHRVSPFGVSTANNVYKSPSAYVTDDCFEVEDSTEVQMASAGNAAIRNIIRGSALRIASDLSGGTPLESIKTRVTVTTESMSEAFRNIVKKGGVGALWAGTPSRTVEGALLGAFFMIGSVGAKKQVFKMGGSSIMASLAGGLTGGLAQAVIMTPAGMVFTSLNVNKGKKGYENDNAYTVAKRIIEEKGIRGMFIGAQPMAIRQASNWASRSCFTEIARTSLRMSEYGLLGEIGSGVIGGVGSCWNTPVETARVLMQKDTSEGKNPKSFTQYTKDIYEKEGIPGLFRGVTPRGIQAIWQTVFMVVVPNILGV